MNRKSKIIVAGCIGVAIIGIGAFCLWGMNAPPTVTVSLIGFKTNNVGGRLAGFNVTNTSALPLNWAGTCSIQPEGQPATKLPFSGLMATLPPRQVQTIWIPCPTNQGNWRVSFGYRPADWRNRFGRWLNRSRWGTAVKARLKFIPIRNQSAGSEWVGN